MHSDRLPHSPPTIRRDIHHRALSTDQRQTLPSAPPHQTSLPSIRQLHPYLPPSGMSQHQPAGESSSSPSYSYPAPSSYAGQNPVQHDQPPIHFSAPQRDEPYGGADSDGDDGDQQGPPKKKRRRQALSCTECKRRKIKCDRSQPCGPCTRRGEQAKCQWHIVEPVEKYVTRAEYDDLKARFDHLESVVARLYTPAAPGSINIPYYQMGLSPGMPGPPPPEAVPQYHAGPPPGPPVYQPMMPPHYPPHLDNSQQPTHRYTKPVSPRHSQQSVGGGSTSPIVPTTAVLSSPRHLPQHHNRPPDLHPKSPGSGAAKRSPLSLASITFPYHSNLEQQSKNFHAQTPTLGGCLRRVHLARADPAAPSNESSCRPPPTPLRLLARRARRAMRHRPCTLNKARAHRQHLRCRDDIATHISFSLASRQSATVSGNI